MYLSCALLTCLFLPVIVTGHSRSACSSRIFFFSNAQSCRVGFDCSDTPNATYVNPFFFSPR